MFREALLCYSGRANTQDPSHVTSTAHGLPLSGIQETLSHLQAFGSKNGNPTAAIRQTQQPRNHLSSNNDSLPSHVGPFPHASPPAHTGFSPQETRLSQSSNSADSSSGQSDSLVPAQNCPTSSIHPMTTRSKNGIFKPWVFTSLSTGFLPETDPTSAKKAIQDPRWLKVYTGDSTNQPINMKSTKKSIRGNDNLPIETEHHNAARLMSAKQVMINKQVNSDGWKSELQPG
ncbi:hypothetical protein LWI29_022357 [Acer saccharum]|uniref:Uncharacterized protein n=1 Tax=Acer saccharum TaxID=4024 RepID=A0AA39RQJ0_ACESA|nr:hypothetical protein LWI29_022357 [Acer saccharum]